MQPGLKHKAAQERDPDTLQRRASDPAVSVWVGASAGSGKTKVLTDRVLRLMLPRADGAPGTLPHRILCLTFTKAGASEMALRLNKRLGAWAVQPEGKLRQSLESLFGYEPSENDMTAARRLFAQVADTPGGLNIMTIHAFCGSVLSRFPLEAGLPPGFTTLTEREAQSLLTQARDMVLNRARRDFSSGPGKALAALAAAQNESQFDGLLKKLCSERRRLMEIVDAEKGVENLWHAICRTLNVDPDKDEDTLLREACAAGAFDETGLRRACAALAQGTLKKDQPKAIALQDWLDRGARERAARIDSYIELFLTKEGALRKEQMTPNLQKKFPDEEKAMVAEALRLFDLADRRNAARCAALTHALLLFGQEILHEYETLKLRQAALDFDDLINKTKRLLEETEAAWVLYKLDGGLDHILIDEAQDTNPEQWDIAESLCAEFFQGLGAREEERTLFVVGDEKQSIYGFQRAAPEKFRKMRAHLKKKVEDSGHEWRDVPLNTSFRSTPAVLDFVDAVFHDSTARAGLTEHELRHISHRHMDAGLVEMWPLFKLENDAEKPDPWAPPVKVKESVDAAALLAGHIAVTIRRWIDEKETIPGRVRPVQAGDVMILVRSRTKLVGHMIRAMKAQKIPVGGLDRMVLSAQLAVQDLLALAQVSLLPDDDLSLACVLKSPLIGWSDESLEILTAGRSGTLWQALRNGVENEVAGYIGDLVRRAAADHPYEFFSRILQSPCPADPQSGLHAMTARLGEDILDPLDEFLNLALAYESDNIAALQTFMLWFRRGESEVKREQEEAGGRVRIMTVHASKGLQAPIVILPDTIKYNQGGGNRAAERLLWPDKTGFPVPVWSPHGGSDCRAYAEARERARQRDDEEDRRLLYVAMTRAEDRLYIGGYAGDKNPDEKSWYFLARRGFDHARLPVENVPFDLPGGLEPGDFCNVLRITNEQSGAPARVENGKGGGMLVRPDFSAHPWLTQKPEPESDPPKPLIPSHAAGMADDETPASSPLSPQGTHRFRRGIITHRLLQTLPDLPAASWQKSAPVYIRRAASDMPDDIQESIVRETLGILTDPRFATLFGPGSRAEVPLTGLVNGRIISGQIDRLLVTEREILIVDYKTNRPPPMDEKEVPAAYRAQMRAYGDTLAAIYPGKTIRCFLLWTDGPRMMEVCL